VCVCGLVGVNEKGQKDKREEPKKGGFQCSCGALAMHQRIRYTNFILCAPCWQKTKRVMMMQMAQASLPGHSLPAITIPLSCVLLLSLLLFAPLTNAADSTKPSFAAEARQHAFPFPSCSLFVCVFELIIESDTNTPVFKKKQEKHQTPPNVCNRSSRGAYKSHRPVAQQRQRQLRKRSPNCCLIETGDWSAAVTKNIS
jgi:hypothetical protein